MKWIETGILLIAVIFFNSCDGQKPVPVKLNVDNCDHCKMTIADTKFAAELITSKGRLYKFDDIKCVIAYQKENPQLKNSKIFVTDFPSGVNFIEISKASLIRGGNINSPMGGNVAAFSKKTDAEAHATRSGATPTTWEALNK